MTLRSIEYDANLILIGPNGGGKSMVAHWMILGVSHGRPASKSSKFTQFSAFCCRDDGANASNHSLHGETLHKRIARNEECQIG